jgi:ABC-type polysaccharide/polyol phosphate export permease
MRGAKHYAQWSDFYSSAHELAGQGLNVNRWWGLAWADMRFRYRRTLFGPFWITLSMAVTVFSVGLLFGALFGNDLSQYLPYFATGLIVWTFISQCIMDGCLVYIQSAGYIKSMPVPLTLHAYRMLGRQLIAFGHNIILVLVLWVAFQWPVSFAGLLALPGLAIASAALFGAALILGIICARYRDMHQIITSVMSLLFLLTPVIWLPGSIRSPALDAVVYGNPFHYLLAVVRQPLLGSVPDLRDWLVAVGIAAVVLLAGTLIHARFRHRVVYWL